ncbi:hypothetical protein FA95DRAFT_1577045 [Auriscalpium vulgare]|uniref:Uncharacterized protein n=1 Tax=Auriscalpium vulgare TaxID=40419 RepID=A0ACB8R9N0_9AGAM|nr:hypothetical protein FA95DRAFT_1577045 [Auriscalpium vulgare]
MNIQQLLQLSKQSIRSREVVLQKPLTPVVGAYILVTINPTASLARLHDPIAIEQATALSNLTFLGYVSHILDLPNPMRQYHKCACRFVSRGLPQADLSEGTDETMCVPVGHSSHPAGREGVSASPPLPWDNLYHHSFTAVELRLESKKGDYRKSSLLPHAERWKMTLYIREDKAHSKELRQAHKIASQNAGAPSLDSLPVTPPQVESSERVDSRAVGQDSTAVPSTGSQPEPSTDNHFGDVMHIMGNSLMGEDDPEDWRIPIATFSTEVTATSEFCDATLLPEYLDAIDKIRHDSEQRRRISDERERLEKEESGRDPISNATRDEPAGSSHNKRKREDEVSKLEPPSKRSNQMA